MSGYARSSKLSRSTSSGGSDAAITMNTMDHSMKTIISLLHAEARMTIVALACLVLFAGCSFAPKYTTPGVQTPAAFKELAPEQFKEVEGWKTAQPQDSVIRGKWWEMFHEPELNALEDQVAASNQTVAAAFAN